MFGNRRAQLQFVLPLLVACLSTERVVAQTHSPHPEAHTEIDRSGPHPSAAAAGDLTPTQSSQLASSLAAHDYTAAETLLLAEINRDPSSPHAARLLALIGHVYFLNADYLNAAIAWKKSEKIAPLDPSAEFSLAMVYIRLHHPEWARPLLDRLNRNHPDDALYPYWLGRLDYDAQHFDSAIAHFTRAIALRPDMARAYDNLGLCYFSQNKNPLAIENYRKAIDLDPTSAWPHLNLAIALHFLNHLDDAKAELQEALRLDPNLAQAHYELGLVLEAQQHFDPAITALSDAASLDPNYPEPHVALARIYRRQGRKDLAQQQVQLFQQLRAKAQPTLNPHVH